MLRNLLAELKSRGVTRSAAIYAAAAWGLLQVADIVFPLMRLPEWSLTVMLFLAALGFPVALAIAWFYDMSLEGLQPADITEATEARPFSLWRMLEFGLIVLLVVTVGVLYLERFSMRQERSKELAQQNPIGERSIAVLPFENMSEDPAYAYFGDGLSEEILNRLVRVPDLQVAARTSSFKYRGGGTDIREIGGALSVRYVLEGSVRRQADHIRVTAQFIDASTGYHLWSQNFDREIRDIFSIQDDIALRVVSSLQLILDPDAANVLTRPTTVSTEAYEAYLQGRDSLRQGSNNDAESLARDLFEKALKLDPAFAEAWAGLCDSYLGEFRESHDATAFEAAEKSCHRALTLDNTAVAVYVALGNLYISSGQTDRAIMEFEQAIALSPKYIEAYIGQARSLEEADQNEQAQLAYRRLIDLAPNDPQAHSRMGSFHFRAGRATEAIPAYLRASELAPDNADIINSLGASWYLLGDYERAAAAWTRSIALRPTAHAYSNTGTSYYYLGRFEEAVAMYQSALKVTPRDYELWGAIGDCYKALLGQGTEARVHYLRAVELAEEIQAINPQSADVAALLAHYQAALGEKAVARALIAQVQAMEGADMYVYYDLAIAYAALGDPSSALAQLRSAIAAGYSRDLVMVDPGLASLREVPGFTAIVEYPGTGG